MNCLLVPSLGLDDALLLNRLADSIDHYIPHKIVINNGRADSLVDFEKKRPDWRVMHFGHNLGCAGSWNIFATYFRDQASCLISNEDEIFQPGALRQICKAADEHLDAPIIFLNDQDAYDCFVWTRAGVEQFGTFDENFWPAYFEDYEMTARFLAHGGKPFRMTDNIPVKHGKPKPCSKAYHAAIKACGDMNQHYLKMKWGRDDEIPLFKHPFNDPSQSVAHWTLHSLNRSMREHIFYNWFNSATSIYE